MVDDEGWSWVVADEPDGMLSVKDIVKVNKHLGKRGVKINKLNKDFPQCQVLCG